MKGKRVRIVGIQLPNLSPDYYEEKTKELVETLDHLVIDPLSLCDWKVNQSLTLAHLDRVMFRNSVLHLGNQISTTFVRTMSTNGTVLPFIIGVAGGTASGKVKFLGTRFSYIFSCHMCISLSALHRVMCDILDFDGHGQFNTNMSMLKLNSNL